MATPAPITLAVEVVYSETAQTLTITKIIVVEDYLEPTTTQDYLEAPPIQTTTTIVEVVYLITQITLITLIIKIQDYLEILKITTLEEIYLVAKLILLTIQEEYLVVILVIVMLLEVVIITRMVLSKIGVISNMERVMILIHLKLPVLQQPKITKTKVFWSLDPRIISFYIVVNSMLKSNKKSKNKSKETNKAKITKAIQTPAVEVSSVLEIQIIQIINRAEEVYLVI